MARRKGDFISTEVSCWYITRNKIRDHCITGFIRCRTEGSPFKAVNISFGGHKLRSKNQKHVCKDVMYGLGVGVPTKGKVSWVT